MGKMSGKVAVITGAASGIGRQSAIRMAQEGAIIVGGDLNPEGGEETIRLCCEAGGDGASMVVDVSREEDVSALIGLAVEKFGGIDVMFNNVGISGAVGQIENITVEDWDRTQHIVLRSAFLGIKHSVPHLRARGGGSIIQTSSMAGIRGFPYLAAYCASKAGMVNLTRSAAIELGVDHIRVNCICPGDIMTPMRSSGLSPEDMARELASHQPIPVAGQADDIAGAVLYLASDDSKWVTGTVIPIDGGATIGVWTYGQNSDLSHLKQGLFLEPSYIREKKKAAAAAASGN